MGLSLATIFPYIYLLIGQEFITITNLDIGFFTAGASAGSFLPLLIGILMDSIGPNLFIYCNIFTIGMSFLFLLIILSLKRFI